MLFGLKAHELGLIVELTAVGVGFFGLILYEIWINIFGVSFCPPKVDDPVFDAFFQTLTKKQRQEFVWWFVYEPSKKVGLKRHLFINNENNQSFFKDFVRYSSTYKNKLSIDLVFKMFEFAKYNYYEPSYCSYIDAKQIKYLYSQKNNPTARKICKELCYEKIQNNEEIQNNFIYLKYLINLETKDDIEKAISLCQKAAYLNPNDKGGYESKIKKLKNKLEKAPKSS
ncbi:MAG TPA: hypothetical protein GX745_00355 [Clostridiales bacterium]|nr:hypothetical protein [Clostridiales bacterium]